VIVWVDAQLPPGIAGWLAERFGVECYAVRDLGLRDASDLEIFLAARAANAVVLTKDGDFVRLLDRRGPPPQVIWLTIGNTSNAALRAVLTTAWPRAQKYLSSGEPLVEVRQDR